MGELVLADRHDVAVAEQDVGGLMDRVGEHQARRRRQARRRALLLDRRVAPELGDADEAEERDQQLVELGNLGVREDRRPLGIDADRQVVGHQLLDVGGQRRGAVAVDDRLIVGDEHDRVHANFLEAHPIEQRPEVVAEVQRARRSIARQDPIAARILDKRRLQPDRARLRLG